ncbi:hypothetical protein EYF80_044046 [Liparis tanakae]|uniref:Uncharacterized protein n=1 Tax=Liparis tanakae TaxID=230148 RepID=A0A4Z2FWT7_9TELE|nr:hypothetical protein EYF80_044046 [Liparis tanakae]
MKEVEEEEEEEVEEMEEMEDEEEEEEEVEMEEVEEMEEEVEGSVLTRRHVSLTSELTNSSILSHPLSSNRSGESQILQILFDVSQIADEEPRLPAPLPPLSPCEGGAPRG